MRQILPLLACALGSHNLMTMPAHATDCTTAMIAPLPGQTLPLTALDANNACVAYLQQRSTAVDLSAKIADSERRIKGEKPGDRQATTPRLPPPVASEPTQDPVLPQTDSLYVDQHGASAILVFVDGSTAEVTTGTGLPDGLKVTAITRTGVFVRTADGRAIRLNDATAGFAAQPTRSTISPGRPPYATTSTFSSMPGTP